MLLQEIKNVLADPKRLIESRFKVLREIAQRVNRHDTHDEGRDLVIRALSAYECFSGGDRELLMSLVRNVGLFPYMGKDLEAADLHDQIAYEMHRADHLGGELVFHSLQAKIFYQLLVGNNVVLSASTSVGKSLVVDALIATEKYSKIVIIVPTLALMDETRRRISARFGQECAVITHHSQKSVDGKRSVFILTQERALLRDDLKDTELVVIDEFYKMDLGSESTPQRSVDLNVVFHNLAKTGAQFYLLGPNIQATNGLSAYEHHFIPSDFTTVAVDIVTFNLPTRGEERKDKLLELLRDMDGPTIIYCQSPGSATEVAAFLVSSGAFPVSQQTSPAVNWISEHYSPDWAVALALKHGIGVHHGGVPRSLQQYFIRLFNNREIPILVCTSTIIEGVNTVARNVVVFDRRRNADVIDHFTYKNIAGRAGRMSQYFVGRVYVLETPPEVDQLSVNCPVGMQNEETPLSLLLGLKNEDLTEPSQERLKNLFKGSEISEETIRANRHVPLTAQESIAKRIRSAPMQSHMLMSWTAMPTGYELKHICELIFEHLSGKALQGYGVFSGAQLAFHINALRLKSKGGMREYIQGQISNRMDGETVSDAVERTMKLIRNIVCRRFPQDLMTINNIQLDVLPQFGFGVGDYSLFAEHAENCFYPSLLFALDEYGLPVQTAEKISGFLLPADDLDAVLRNLRGLPSGLNLLDPFEQDVLHDVQESIPLTVGQ